MRPGMAATQSRGAFADKPTARASLHCFHEVKAGSKPRWKWKKEMEMFSLVVALMMLRVATSHNTRPTASAVCKSTVLQCRRQR